MPGFVLRDGHQFRARPRLTVARRILLIGDSKPMGYGDPPIGDPLGGIFDGPRLALWQAFLARGILVKFVGPFANASSAESTAACGGRHGAAGGTVISQATSAVASQITTYAPDVILADTATNDVDGGATTTANITTNYNALLDTIRGVSSTVPVVMTKCIPLLSANGISFMASCYTQLDAIFTTRSATDPNLFKADCSGFPNRPGMYSVRNDGFADLYHPSHIGHQYVALNYYLPALASIPILAAP